MATSRVVSFADEDEGRSCFNLYLRKQKQETLLAIRSCLERRCEGLRNELVRSRSTCPQPTRPARFASARTNPRPMSQDHHDTSVLCIRVEPRLRHHFVSDKSRKLTATTSFGDRSSAQRVRSTKHVATHKCLSGQVVRRLTESKRSCTLPRQTRPAEKHNQVPGDGDPPVRRKVRRTGGANCWDGKVPGHPVSTTAGRIQDQIRAKHRHNGSRWLVPNHGSDVLRRGEGI